jgi:hypothetical protein
VPMSVATHAYTSSPSIAVTNALTNTLENGLRPGSMSPTNANALRRLLGAAGGAAGVGMSPLVFGNTAQ